MKQLLSHLGTLYCTSNQRLFEAQEIKALVKEKQESFKANGISGLQVSLIAHSDIHFLTSLLALLEENCGVLLISPQESEESKKTLYQEYPCSFEIGPIIINRLQLIKSTNSEICFTTSGTTGRPKIINCTVRDLQKKIEFLRASFDSVELVRCACVLSLSFGHGLIGTLLFPLLTGNQVILIEPTLGNLLKASEYLHQYQVSFISATPHTYRILTQYSQEILSLKRVQIASAHFDQSLIKTLKGLAPQAKIVNAYGLTEFFSWISFKDITNINTANIISLPHQSLLKDESGHLNENEGELFVHHQTSPYWDKVHNFVVHQGEKYIGTGDILKKTNEGYQILSRKDDLISINAIKFYPQEIEHYFQKDITGRNYFFIHLSELGLNLLLIEGKEDQALIENLKQKALDLPTIKRPQRILFLDHFPLTNRGKISRKGLRDLCLAMMKS